MNGFDFLKDKIGRKQLICIATMIILAQVGAPAYQIALIGFAGIASQFGIDWLRPRTKGKNNGDTPTVS